MRNSVKFVALIVFASLFSTAFLQTAPAQKLVDPDKVAPEFREAAAKRRAEQIKSMECNKKADEAKALRRDRASHVRHCLDGQ
jgi:Skp family chaperone for outer membrane proteins